MEIFQLSVLLIWATFSFGQHRIAVYDVEKESGSAILLDDISSYIIANYASDDRFVVIDKANSQLIANEQDRQKSEEFIDGYIVEQGMQEGFDYCYYPKYDKKEKTLSVRVYDIAKGTVVSNQEVELKTSIIGTPKNLKAAILEITDKVNIDCFEIRYEIVRCTKEKKSSAKELLFALGYNQRAKEKQEFDIYQLVEEKVGSKSIERKEVIGRGEITEVQDGNFSTLKVSKGGDVILSSLTAGQQLYGSVRR